MARWIFYGWDEQCFRRMRSLLRSSAIAGSLPDDLPPRSRDALAHLSNPADVAEMCNAVLLAECARGEPVVCEGGLPEFLIHLRRQDQWEELAAALAEVISAGPGMEAWFDVGAGLMGVMPASSVQAVVRGWSVRKPAPPEARGQKWLRRLAPVQDPFEVFMQIVDLLAQCAESRLGLAAVLEN